MSTGSVRKGLNWETEACAFTVAIVLARVRIHDISSKFGSRHKFTAKELVDYCSELNWASDLDFQVGLAELMQGLHIFNSCQKRVLEQYFHVKIDESKEIPTQSFGVLLGKARSWKITFLENFEFSRPSDINSKHKLMKRIKILRDILLNSRMRYGLK